MREIRTGNHYRPAAWEGPEQRIGQRLHNFPVVSPHQHGHDAASGADPLEEWQFDLDGMFPLVGDRVKLDAGIGGDQRLR